MGDGQLGVVACWGPLGTGGHSRVLSPEAQALGVLEVEKTEEPLPKGQHECPDGAARTPPHPRLKGLVTASGKEDTEYQTCFNRALVSMCQFHLPAQPLSDIPYLWLEVCLL